MTTTEAIALARKHVHNPKPMQSSSALCLDRAVQADIREQADSAIMWAAQSLKYSVGVFHADYQTVYSFITTPRTGT